jgi:chromosome segregation ATPase
VQGLIDRHVATEADLEPKLRQARSLYQEVRPAELKLDQAKRERGITCSRLDNAKAEIHQVQDTISKATTKLHRLQEQQELQKAKLARLDATLKEQHDCIGKGGRMRKSTAALCPSPAQDIKQNPEFQQLQQQVAALQKALQEATAASRSEQQKRERDSSAAEEQEGPTSKK